MPFIITSVNAESLAGCRIVLSSVLPGTLIDLPGDKLPDGCLWPERQLILFKNYPDLKLIYDTGHLVTVQMEQSATYPNVFVLHFAEGSEIPDGVYLPELTGNTLFKPWSPNTYPQNKPGDVVNLKMGYDAAGAVIIDQVYQAKCVYVGRYVV